MVASCGGLSDLLLGWVRAVQEHEGHGSDAGHVRVSVSLCMYVYVCVLDGCAPCRNMRATAPMLGTCV